MIRGPFRQGTLIFSTRICDNYCAFNNIFSGYCHYSNEWDIWTVFFLNEIWLIKYEIDKKLFAYIISCQEVQIPCIQLLCMCED